MYSYYYEKDVNISEEEAEILYDIYSEIAEIKEFEKEASSAEEIMNDSSIYDHVAYHVETFGSNNPNFEDIAYLFND